MSTRKVVEIPRATLAWFIDLAEDTYHEPVSPEIEYRVHVSIAHEALGTVSTIVPEAR